MSYDVMRLDAEICLLAEERFGQCHINEAFPGVLDLLPDKATAQRFKDPDLVDDLKAVWLAREYALIAGRKPSDRSFESFVASVFAALFPNASGLHNIHAFVGRRLAILQQLDELNAFA
jgi:hypothetical protein